MFNLKNFLLSSYLLFSIFSSPVYSNPKVLKVGAIPDQNQDVLDKRFNLFSKENIEFLPLSSIFINNISHKYVHMVSLLELRKIIDKNENLKKSTIIMNIYNNKHIIPLKDIYNNVELTMLNDFIRRKCKSFISNIY